MDVVVSKNGFKTKYPNGARLGFKAIAVKVPSTANTVMATNEIPIKRFGRVDSIAGSAM